MMVRAADGEKVKLTFGTWIGLASLVGGIIVTAGGTWIAMDRRLTVVETQNSFIVKQLDELRIQVKDK